MTAASLVSSRTMCPRFQERLLSEQRLLLWILLTMQHKEWYGLWCNDNAGYRNSAISHFLNPVLRAAFQRPLMCLEAPKRLHVSCLHSISAQESCTRCATLGSYWVHNRQIGTLLTSYVQCFYLKLYARQTPSSNKIIEDYMLCVVF